MATLTAITAIPEPGPEGLIALSEASRTKIGVTLGDIVRVEYDGNAVQRRVIPFPKHAVKIEKSGKFEFPLCFISTRDWRFLGINPPSSVAEAVANRISVSKAEDWIETP